MKNACVRCDNKDTKHFDWAGGVFGFFQKECKDSADQIGGASYLFKLKSVE